jgi:outer membrane receptor for ferrienterochelin and colicin
VPQINVAGYGSFGDPYTVYLTHNNIWEGHDTASWTLGKHFLMIGAVYQPIHYHQTGNQAALGSLSMDGSATGNPQVAGSVGNSVADFLLGYLSFTQVGIQPADAELHGTYYAGFVGDTWRLNQKLTIDYGVRYEYLTPLADQTDNSSNLTKIDTSAPILVRASNKGTNLDPYAGITARLTNVPIVRDGRLGPGLVNPDKNNFAPRLGISYALDDKTVVRAGIGTFYDVLDMGNSIYDMSRTLAGLRR